MTNLSNHCRYHPNRMSGHSVRSGNTCMRKCRDFGYPDGGFSWYSSVPRTNYGVVIRFMWQQPPARSFPIHSTLRRHVLTTPKASLNNPQKKSLDSGLSFDATQPSLSREGAQIGTSRASLVSLWSSMLKPVVSACNNSDWSRWRKHMCLRYFCEGLEVRIPCRPVSLSLFPGMELNCSKLCNTAEQEGGHLAV
jgi:hypothetical protein